MGSTVMPLFYMLTYLYRERLFLELFTQFSSHPNDSYWFALNLVTKQIMRVYWSQSVNLFFSLVRNIDFQMFKLCIYCYIKLRK